jgi:glycine/D-amino acid oxidase-like deaminating enzyme
LSPDSDVVVVGAGIMGLMTAVRLQAAGHNVVVIEAEKQIGHSQSGKWTGVVHLPGRRYINGGTGMYEAQEFFATTFPAAQLASTGWEVGSPAHIKERLESYRRHAPTSVVDKFEFIEPDAVGNIYPELGHLAAATVPEPVFDPLELLRDLTARALAVGVEFRLGSSVTAVDANRGSACSATLTNGERIHGDLVILAAGPGLNDLLGERGLQAQEAERLRVRMMTIVLVDWEGTRDTRGQRITVNGFHESGDLAFGVVPAADGWSRAGVPNESVGGLPVIAEGSNRRSLPKARTNGSEESLRKLAEIFPASNGARRFTYEVLRTDQPADFADPTPRPNAFVYRHGEDGRIVSVNPGKAGQAGAISASLVEEITGHKAVGFPSVETSERNINDSAAMVVKSFLDFGRHVSRDLGRPSNDLFR